MQLLKKFKGQEKEAFEALVESFAPDLGDHLPFWALRLTVADEEKDKNHQKVLELAREVVGRVDAGELARYLGQKQPEKQDPALKKRMEEGKGFLIDALKRTTEAHLDLFNEAKEPEEKAKWKAAFEESCADLEKWAELTGPSYISLAVGKRLVAGQVGGALKVLQKYLGETDPIPEKKYFELKKTLLATLGWDHWEDYEVRWNILRFPQAYPRF